LSFDLIPAYLARYTTAKVILLIDTMKEPPADKK